MANTSPIPLKSFGKTGIQISALGLGGHHLGAAKDEQTAVEIVHRAVEGGITFFDCCWVYNRGKSEDWLGKGVKGRRDKVFLMTKVCTHGDGDAVSVCAEVAQRMLRPTEGPFGVDDPVLTEQEPGCKGPRFSQWGEVAVELGGAFVESGPKSGKTTVLLQDIPGSKTQLSAAMCINCVAANKESIWSMPSDDII